MRIYLDHNATTPVRPSVAEAMSGVLRAEFGNPSSVYEEGALARARVEAARSELARLLAIEPRSIRWTGGATEANNTLLFGLLSPGDHIVTTEIEHPSVAAPLELLESRGVEVTRIAPDETGCVAAETVLGAVRSDTRLVSVIWANNETGSLQPVADIVDGCRARGVMTHSDATQAVGKAVINLASVPLDFLSTSAHKLGGPKGVGALIVRGDPKLPAYLHGGGQEYGLRGGTENVAGIVGFGEACVLAREELADRLVRHGGLRDRLWAGLQKRIDGLRWNGDRDRQLSNTLNVEFEGLAGEVLVQALDVEGIAVSAGAACHSGSIEPSKILLAMGRTPEQARASIRLSVGWGVDEGQVDRVAEVLGTLVPRIRAAEAP